MKLLEHEMKIIERVLEKRIKALVAVMDDMQFGFMPGRVQRQREQVWEEFQK